MADFLNRRPAFVLMPDRAEEFLLLKCDQEAMKKHTERAEFFIRLQKEREERIFEHRPTMQDEVFHRYVESVIEMMCGNDET